MFLQNERNEKLCKILEMHQSCFLETLVDYVLMNGNYLIALLNSYYHHVSKNTLAIVYVLLQQQKTIKILRPHLNAQFNSKLT